MTDLATVEILIASLLIRCGAIGKTGLDFRGFTAERPVRDRTVAPGERRSTRPELARESSPAGTSFRGTHDGDRATHSVATTLMARKDD
jgi:hypothetical protein